jgi:hypothetical protein
LAVHSAAWAGATIESTASAASEWRSIRASFVDGWGNEKPSIDLLRRNARVGFSADPARLARSAGDFQRPHAAAHPPFDALATLGG